MKELQQRTRRNEPCFAIWQLGGTKHGPQASVGDPGYPGGRLATTGAERLAELPLLIEPLEFQCHQLTGKAKTRSAR